MVEERKGGKKEEEMEEEEGEEEGSEGEGGEVVVADGVCDKGLHRLIRARTRGRQITFNTAHTVWQE